MYPVDVTLLTPFTGSDPRHGPEYEMEGVFYSIAAELMGLLPPGPERTAMVGKLIEAKDAAIRARRNPGG